MNKKVVISCDEQGQYSVGEMAAAGSDPFQGESQEPEMQPARSLDEALDMAAGMFESDPEGEAEAQADFSKGFQKTMGPEGM